MNEITYFSEYVPPVKEKSTVGPPVCFVGALAFRIKSPICGTHVLNNNLSIKIKIYDDKSFDWRANTAGIRSIIVNSGGKKENIYYYDGKQITGVNLKASECKKSKICRIDICFEPNHACPADFRLDCANVCYDPISQHPPHILDCNGVCYNFDSTPPHSVDSESNCIETVNDI